MQRGNTTETTDGTDAPFFDGTQVCAQVDPDLFFPEPDEKGFYKKQAEAKALCRQCAFIIPCLEFALKDRPLGIWGGTTFSERKRMKRAYK